MLSPILLLFNGQTSEDVKAYIALRNEYGSRLCLIHEVETAYILLLEDIKKHKKRGPKPSNVDPYQDLVIK